MAEERIFTRAFVMMAMVNLMVFFGWQTILTGLPLYLDSLGADSVFVGLTNTMATAAAVVVRPLSGVVVDRYGRKGTLVWGFGVMVVAIVCYAIFPVAGIILAMRFIQGIGWGFGSTANSTMTADVLPKTRFAEAMGYFAMTNSLSMALAPAFAIWMMDNNLGIPMIYIGAATTAASMVIAIIFFMTDYKQPPLKTDISLKEALAPKNMFVKSALLPSSVMLFLSCSFGSISTFLALMAADRGISGAALYFVIYAIANLVLRPLVGRWTDKKGFFWPGLVACVSTVVSLVIIATAGSLTALIVAGVFVGLGMGTAMGVFQTMSVTTVAPSSRGSAMSTYLFLFNAGISIGSFMAGVLVDLVGFLWMYMFMAGFAAIGGVVFVAAGKKRVDAYSELQHSGTGDGEPAVGEGEPAVDGELADAEPVADDGEPVAGDGEPAVGDKPAVGGEPADDEPVSGEPAEEGAASL